MIRNSVSEYKSRSQYCPKAEMVSDSLSKPFRKVTFEKCTKGMALGNQKTILAYEKVGLLRLRFHAWYKPQI